MTWKGLKGKRHFKKPECEWEGGREGGMGKRHKEKRRIERDKNGEVGEVKFGERVFIKRAEGDGESRRDM